MVATLADLPTLAMEDVLRDRAGAAGHVVGARSLRADRLFGRRQAAEREDTPFIVLRRGARDGRGWPEPEHTRLPVHIRPLQGQQLPSAPACPERDPHKVPQLRADLSRDLLHLLAREEAGAGIMHADVREVRPATELALRRRTASPYCTVAGPPLSGARKHSSPARWR